MFELVLSRNQCSFEQLKRLPLGELKSLLRQPLFCCVILLGFVGFEGVMNSPIIDPHGMWEGAILKSP